MRAFELGEIQFGHREQRLHHAIARLRIRVVQQIVERRWKDLPGYAELVLQPPALHFLSAAFGQLAPKRVELFLRLALDDERHGLVETDDRAAVERDVLLAVELEANGHHAAVWSRAGRAVMRRLQDLRVLEQGDVELGGRFGLAVEPETRPDPL